MKTKIQVLAMMFIAAMAFGACDDDDKNDNIKAPDAVSKAQGFLGKVHPPRVSRGLSRGRKS